MRYPDLIPRDEWDFKDCPPEALQTCLIYEFSREAEDIASFISDCWIAIKDLAPDQRARSLRTDEHGNIGMGLIWENQEWILWAPEAFATTPFLKLLGERRATFVSKMPLDGSILEPASINTPVVQKLESHELRHVWPRYSTWFFAIDSNLPNKVIEQHFSAALLNAREKVGSWKEFGGPSPKSVEELLKKMNASGNRASLPAMRKKLNQLAAFRLLKALKAKKFTSIAKAAEEYLKERGRTSFFKDKGGWSDACARVSEVLHRLTGITHLLIRPLPPPTSSK